MSADNLGAGAIGGFKEGSTATHGCRQCMCTIAEFSLKVIHVVIKLCKILLAYFSLMNRV